MTAFTISRARPTTKRKPDTRNLRKRLTHAVWAALEESGWRYDGRTVKFDLTDEKWIIASVEITHENPAMKPTTALISKMRAELIKIGWAIDDVEAPTSLISGAAPVDSYDVEALPSAEEPLAPAEEVLAPINMVQGEFFSHIFERDHQIKLLLSSVQAFMTSEHKNRFHVVIYGPPGCGKTDVMHTLIAMLGPEHVLLLDGPGTTKAGAEQLLMSTNRIKPFLFIEEGEKMSVKHQEWLLGLLDDRGEIRRTNARDGHVQREAKVLCVVTVNDLKRFKAVSSGALASRFSHEIYFPAPDRDLLHKIVLREVLAVNGNPDWVAPAVQYCVHVERTYDPRRAISVCLSGREGLIDGTYLRALVQNLALNDPKLREDLKMVDQKDEA